MNNKQDTINLLKQKIAEKQDNTNSIRSKDNDDANVLMDALNLINAQNIQIANLNTQLAKQDIDNTISTTQFFNPSLAKDMYNMNGNSLCTNSYMAIRQMLGIVNNSTPNVLHPTGLNSSIAQQGNINNGTAVGLTTNQQVQGWWLWELVLERITYFNNLFTIECENKKLLKAIHEYIQCVILSGHGCIEKVGDKYKAWAITNTKYNEYGDIISAQKYNPGFVMNTQSLKDNEGLMEFKENENTITGKWRSDGYNIWFFVMSYLFNAVDLIYIYWNRGRLNKTIVEQRKGNNSTASIEAMNYINPYQNVVTINTVNILADNNQMIEKENRYDIKDLGNGQETQFSYTTFSNWIWFWDNTYGIRSTSGSGGDGTRSITDEVQPLKLRINKIQNDMLFNLQCMLDEIKEKWNIEVKASIQDMDEVKENPETKDEGGQEGEQNENNGTNSN